jgi:hypothetical protein
MPQKKTEMESGDISAESGYVAHTPEQMRQLAIDVAAGSVFGSWQLPEHDMQHVNLIFMPLMFMDDIMVKEMQRDGAMHFYGHMRDSFDRGINGYPIFMSVRVIDAADCARLNQMLKALEALNEGN